MVKKMKKKNDRAKELLVFITTGDSNCDECGQNLGKGAWITLQGSERKAACLNCADLDHLVFLPSGDAALTRRSRKLSKLAAVVVKWSRARKRYERQGLFVENEAIEQAELECKADANQREMRRARATERRTELDEEYIGLFAAQIRALYPGCPEGREKVVAEHACRKYSGRVGRSAAAKELDENAVRLAITAHIRHQETTYDELLLQGFDRGPARAEVRSQLSHIIKQWQTAKS